jgi:hypothetical protein
MVSSNNISVRNSEKSSLGSDRKIGVQIPQPKPRPDGETPTEYRFSIQRAARSVIGNYDHRLMGCCVRQHPMAGAVEVWRDPATNSAHFRGLEQCSRVWTCPVCAQRITRERRKELTYALAAAKLKGWAPVLMTFTLRHTRDDTLESLIDGLGAAVRRFKSGREYQDFKSEWRIQGGIKALEVTYGENGWHPHVHEIVFLDFKANSRSMDGMKRWAADLWLAALGQEGFSASYEHGLDIRTADSDVADYVAKWGHEPRELAWGVENEIAGAPNKKAHFDGLTPFQLLECVGNGDAQARMLFQEYASVMQGKRQLVWTRGLRAALEMPDELPDEQLPLFEDTPESYVVARFEYDQWKRCALYELQPKILAFAGWGATVALNAVLARRHIRAELYDPPGESIAEEQIVSAPGGPEIHQQLTLVDVPAAVRYE